MFTFLKLNSWIRFILCMMIAFLANDVFSQNRISVTSEDYDDQETTCMTYPQKDRNNKDCALIIFHNVEPEGYLFDTKGIYSKAINKVSRDGEKIIYLYISDGAKNITIKHQDEGIHPLNYSFENGPLRKLQTYHIHLGQVFRMSEVGSQYLEFSIFPSNATLEVEEDAITSPGVYTPWVVDNTGKAQKLMRYGTYKYRITAPDYASSYGSILVNSPNEPVREQISLSPKFGYLSITSANELHGAIIYVDGRKVGESQISKYKLSSGTHVLKITKKLFKLYEKEFSITDGNTTYINPVLESNSANVVLTVPDYQSDIYIREGNKDERLGTGIWDGKLEPGNYLIVSRRKGHKDNYKQISVSKNSNETFTIPAPIPLYGSINISSNPRGARIILDGEDKGTTPIVINNILVGVHNITIKKDGYNDYSTTVNVNEDRMSDVTCTLDNICKVKINTKGNIYDIDVYGNGSKLNEKNGYYYVNRGTRIKIYADGAYNWTDKKKEYTIKSDKEITIRNHRELLHYSEFYMDAGFIYGIESGIYGGNFSMGFNFGQFNMQADIDYFDAMGYGGRIGWTFRCGTRFRITPQIGYIYYIEEENDILGAIRMNLSLGYRFTLFVSPEYHYGLDSDELSGFQLRSGISVNF